MYVCMYEVVFVMVLWWKWNGF